MSGLRLKDIDYGSSIVVLEDDDGETFEFSFEFFQDIVKYTTREWDWEETHPKEE
jgi:hypothetical protein